MAFIRKNLLTFLFLHFHHLPDIPAVFDDRTQDVVDVFQTHVPAIGKATQQSFLLTQIGQFLLGQAAHVGGVIHGDVFPTSFIVEQVVLQVDDGLLTHTIDDFQIEVLDDIVTKLVHQLGSNLLFALR